MKKINQNLKTFVEKNELLINEVDNLFKKWKKEITYLFVKKDILFLYLLIFLLILYFLLPAGSRIFFKFIAPFIFVFSIFSMFRDKERVDAYSTKDDVKFYIKLWEYVEKHPEFLDKVKEDKVLEFFKKCKKLYSLYKEYEFNK